MKTIFDLRADEAALVERSFKQELVNAELRINQPFCSDVDLSKLEEGTVVYAYDLGLDLDPPQVIGDRYRFVLDSELNIVKVE